MLLQIPDFEISTEAVNYENLIGHFNKLRNDIKVKREISFDQDSNL